MKLNFVYKLRSRENMIIIVKKKIKVNKHFFKKY